jgi:hypothetical protein
MMSSIYQTVTTVIRQAYFLLAPAATGEKERMLFYSQMAPEEEAVAQVSQYDPAVLSCTPVSVIHYMPVATATAQHADQISTATILTVIMLQKAVLTEEMAVTAIIVMADPAAPVGQAAWMDIVPVKTKSPGQTARMAAAAEVPDMAKAVMAAGVVTVMIIIRENPVIEVMAAMHR